MNLTARQIEANRLLGGPQRHTMLVGGARSGKTFLLVRAVLTRALRSQRSRHAIIRFRFKHARQSIWLDTLPKVQRLCFPGVPMDYRERDAYVLLPNGAEIWLGGLDEKERVDKILGQEYSTIYFNECSQIPYASILTALTRLAQRSPDIINRAYYDLNPVATSHWTYLLFVRHRLPDEPLKSVPDPENYAHAFMNPADNAENLDAEFLQSMQRLPARQRKRFWEGKYADEVQGQLWTLDMLEKCHCSADDLPEMRRIVIPIDPSGASGPEDFKADEIGLVPCGLGVDGNGYVLEDQTGLYSPEQWGRLACNLYDKWHADKIVGEKNFGGDMVRSVVQAARLRLLVARGVNGNEALQQSRNVSYEPVTASRGKTIRAEPIAALYERGLVRHAGDFPLLEEELMSFTTAGYIGQASPNRADAAIWGLSYLMLGRQPAELFVPNQDVLSQPSYWRGNQ